MTKVQFGTEFIPLAVVGFIVGAGLGFAWGKKAKSNIGKAVTTDVDGGVVTVQVDTIKAARAGLSDGINNILSAVY
jgi:hypothetical protein